MRSLIFSSENQLGESSLALGWHWRFVFKDVAREKFGAFMRMQVSYSGCKILSYCIMYNHFHILLEVPSIPEEGISDELLLTRLGAIQSEASVAGVAKELADVRWAGNDGRVAEISGRYTYRMHNLSEFMVLRCRVRYFTDGAVIGSKEFVNEAFAGARERFTAKRKDGARKLRGNGAAVAGTLWSVRDLRVRID